MSVKKSFIFIFLYIFFLFRISLKQPFWDHLCEGDGTSLYHSQLLQDNFRLSPYLSFSFLNAFVFVVCFLFFIFKDKFKKRYCVKLHVEPLIKV